MVPVEIDPPRHRAFRRQVNPALTVKAMSPLDDEIRAIADELIDDFIDRGSCDLAVDFARKFPGTVFFRLLAHCTDEDFQLVEPAARQISFESGDNEKLTAATARLRAWAGQVFAQGQQVRKGDKVCLVFGGAGRDPAVFDHPAELDLERPHCRHLAFGAGVHRCIGSNLARQQARIAIRQLVTRLGEFWVPEGGTVRYSSRQARGPLSFPLAFTGPPR